MVHAAVFHGGSKTPFRALPGHHAATWILGKLGAPRCFIGKRPPLQVLPAHQSAATLLRSNIGSDGLRHSVWMYLRRRQLLGLLGQLAQLHQERFVIIVLQERWVVVGHVEQGLEVPLTPSLAKCAANPKSA
jgi:hypothetical protein